ncbi:NAD(P)-binding protein [Rhizodiscina lignyota]|uniref:NAD(P)-binding protein n=1 Tax=Rhizodiscina lignyota TaxID=1504668 RepID=A0A9P4I3B3_9PEZI|nr:NAD(P)-binding protein [Rhizodiscina lignyota]
MVKLAVAGGTGGFGRTLVGELASVKENDVLPTALFMHLTNVEIAVTDYKDEETLTEIMLSHKIETVVSSLNPPLPEVFDRECTLVKAASKASVKRFAPSQFAIDYEKDDDHLPLSWKSGKQQVINELRKHPNLEWTLFLNGYFMDYWAQPHLSAHMVPETPFIDIAAGEASIPGAKGNVKVAFTMTRDVAKFITKAVMCNDKWPEKSYIIGDKMTFDEIVAAAEKARDMKFKVTYNKEEDLRVGKIEPIPTWIALWDRYPRAIFDEMFSAFGLSMVLGDTDFDYDTSLNAKFREIETTKITALIQKYCSKR